MKASRRFVLSSVFTTSTLALTFAGMGCGGVSSTSSSGGKTLSNIAVSPQTASVQMGQTEQFTATAKYTDGSTANVSSTAA